MAGSAQDKKARLRFLQEFDKVVFGGSNDSVTERCKAFAGILACSISKLNQVLYMGKDLTFDDVALIYGALQEKKVQQRITEEGNEAFLDPAVWLPHEQRAIWRKAANSGGPLPTGGRTKGRKPKGESSVEEALVKDAEETLDEITALPKAAKEETPKAQEVGETPLKKRTSDSKRDPGVANIILRGRGGEFVEINVHKGQVVKIQSTTSGGWEVQFHG